MQQASITDKSVVNSRHFWQYLSMMYYIPSFHCNLSFERATGILCTTTTQATKTPRLRLGTNICYEIAVFILSAKFCAPVKMQCYNYRKKNFIFLPSFLSAVREHSKSTKGTHSAGIKKKFTGEHTAGLLQKSREQQPNQRFYRVPEGLWAYYFLLGDLSSLRQNRVLRLCQLVWGLYPSQQGSS